MDTIKIIVSGAFKEKALLTSIIGDKLEEEGLEVTYQDTLANNLVRSRHDDILSEFKDSDKKISLVVENLINTNVTEDLKAFLDDLKTPFWKSGTPEFSRAVSLMDERLRQILQI